MSLPSVRKMSVDAIDTTYLRIDWSSAIGDMDDPSWRSFEATQCEKCDARLVLGLNDGHCSHSDIDSDSDCDGYVSSSEGPMMNYWYPCDFRMSNEDAALAIARLPLCVVEVDGVTGLALTGGGMNLSWEICEAFMLLDMLPPASFVRDLARNFSGTMDTRKEWVASGAKRSLRVQASWARDGIKALSALK